MQLGLWSGRRMFHVQRDERKCDKEKMFVPSWKIWRAMFQRYINAVPIKIRLLQYIFRAGKHWRRQNIDFKRCWSSLVVEWATWDFEHLCRTNVSKSKLNRKFYNSLIFIGTPFTSKIKMSHNYNYNLQISLYQPLSSQGSLIWHCQPWPMLTVTFNSAWSSDPPAWTGSSC